MNQIDEFRTFHATAAEYTFFSSTHRIFSRAAATNMETLYRVPFLVLECPNLKLKKPPWVHMPSAMTVYALVVVSYFLITGGIIYDVIVEPPSVGSMTDEHGHERPVAFLAYRVNGQYIMEGLASSFLFTMGGLGFIILDRSNAPNIPKLNRFLLLFIGFAPVNEVLKAVPIL
uniref:Oligosaccharyltransferase complex subunit n=1 Tax=Canis lupus familiaris TaxID=9615 RepID=A0A8C0PWV4_CANLF